MPKILGRLLWAAASVGAAYCLGAIALNRGEHINSIERLGVPEPEVERPPPLTALLALKVIWETTAIVGQIIQVFSTIAIPSHGDFYYT